MPIAPSALTAFLEEHHDAMFGEPFVERAFDDAEYADRQRRFRAAMVAAGADLTVVTAPDTMAWLHGYRSRWYRHHTSTGLPPAQCTVVDSHGDTLFMIEAGYHEELVRATSAVTDIRSTGSDMEHEEDLDAYLRLLIAQLATVTTSPATVGLELWSCVPSPAVSRRVEQALAEQGHRVVDVTVPARELRRVKSAAEIGKLEQAQAACDAGLLALRDQARPGMTELQAWAVYQTAVTAMGGEPAALHETVAMGPTMPSMHRISSRRPFEPGRIFHADMACAYDGYHARATRPYFLGKPPQELRELTAIAAGAFDVARSHGKAGTPWQDLFSALRAFYAGTGIEGSAAGYEMGITVPPADWVNELFWYIENTDMPGVIEAGTVTNFESFNSLALVDLVVWEEDGPRALSRVPHELMATEG